MLKAQTIMFLVNQVLFGWHGLFCISEYYWVIGWEPNLFRESLVAGRRALLFYKLDTGLGHIELEAYMVSTRYPQRLSNTPLKMDDKC